VGDGSLVAATVTEIQGHGVEAVAIRPSSPIPRQVEDLFTQALRRFGKIDIVVANAGVELIDQPILEATEDQFDRLFAINPKGSFFTLQKARRCGSEHRHGRHAAG